MKENKKQNKKNHEPGLITHKKNFNPLPPDKILDLCKLNAFTDDSFNVAHNKLFFFVWLENIVGIVENTDIQHFLPFATMLQKSSISTALKVVNCVVKGYATILIDIYNAMLNKSSHMINRLRE